jgi:hypothetical protein
VVQASGGLARWGLIWARLVTCSRFHHESRTTLAGPRQSVTLIFSSHTDPNPHQHITASPIDVFFLARASLFATPVLTVYSVDDVAAILDVENISIITTRVLP